MRKLNIKKMENVSPPDLDRSNPYASSLSRRTMPNQKSKQVVQDRVPPVYKEFKSTD